MLGQQYDNMDCKPYSTAKYYEAYRPDVPGWVPVCLKGGVYHFGLLIVINNTSLRHTCHTYVIPITYDGHVAPL